MSGTPCRDHALHLQCESTFTSTETFSVTEGIEVRMANSHPVARRVGMHHQMGQPSLAGIAVTADTRE